jgi:archaellum biogenesis ATPase FlaH
LSVDLISTQLKAALQEEKHANGRLRADIKLKSQDLKVQEEKVRATEEQRQNVLTRIINRLESIDGKCCVISDSLDIISCFIILFSSSNFFESVSSLSPIDWIFSLKLCFSSRS